jgi:hypothetical protein
MVQLAGSVGRVAAPTLAAVLLVSFGLTWVFVIDLSTFLFAVTTLLFVRFPEPNRSSTPAAPGVGALLAEARNGLRFITARRGLFVLLVVFTVVNFTFSFNFVLLIPLLLSVTSPTTVGTVMSISALGVVGGSLLMTAWVGPRDRITGVFVAIGGLGAGFVLAGLRPSLALMVAGVTLVYVVQPVAGSLTQAIWQTKVPPELQGRVFAVRQVMTIAATPVAMLLAGRLADGLFEPFMAGDSTLAVTLGTVVGNGPGRGLGLLFVVLGSVVIATAVIAGSGTSIRNFDDTVPDVVADPLPVGS